MEGGRRLPHGWRLVTIDDVCEIQLGKMLSPAAKTNSRPRRYLRNANVLWNRFDLSSLLEMDFSEEEEKRFELRAGDVLVCEGGEPGRAAVWEGQTSPCFYQKALVRLRPKASQIDPCFLVFRLWAGSFAGEFTGSHAKTTIAHLPAIRLARLPIPLPSLEEQRRIARVLAEEISVIKRAHAAAEAQLALARALPSAHLRAIFGSHEAQRWPCRPLGEVSEIVSGITLGRPLNGSRTRRVPYLRVANVKDGYLDLSDVYEIEASEAEIDKLRLRQSDLLLTEGGDPDKLGRGTIWRDELHECVHQNHIFRVRFDLAQFVPDFVSAQVASPYGKAYFFSHAKRTTGIATINRRVLAAFPLMIPPRTEQERIADALAARIAEAGRLRRALETQLSDVNAIPHALLRRAFSGEL